MDDYCVYCHTFPNGKKYIGITKTGTDKRWRNGDGYKSQPKIARAIAKYGWENVVHDVLAVGLDHDKANDMEQYYIAKYDTLNNGYNATIGGDNIITTYLDSYVTAMICGGRHKLLNFDGSIAEIVYNDRKNPLRAGNWNAVSQYVVEKYRQFSTTSARDIAEYWWYFVETIERVAFIANGGNPSEWEDAPYDRALCYDTAHGRVIHEAVVSG